MSTEYRFCLLKKNKFRLVSLFITFFLFTVFCSPIKVLASNSTLAFDSRQNISPDKIWTIQLSDFANSLTVNKDTIKVIDDDNNLVDLNLSYDKNKAEIQVKPHEKYKEGKTYTLIISGIKSSNNKDLINDIKMNFTIKMDKSSNYDNDDDISSNITNSPKENSYNNKKSNLNNEHYANIDSIAKLIDTHTYEITEILTVTSPTDSNFNLTYNIGSLSNSPYQKELNLQSYGDGSKITNTDTNGKQLAVSSKISSGEKKQYKVVRTVQTSGITYKTDLSNTSGNYSNFSDYDKYTSPTEKIQSDNELIIKKSNQLFKNIDNPFLKAKKAFEFVNTHMTYDKNSGNKDSLYALTTGRGVCEDYSELFVALLRASGVPARVATGFWLEPNEFTNNIADGSINRHAWPEFYLPEYGWIVAEPTFVYKVNGKKTVDFNYFAKLEKSSHIINGYTVDGDNVDSSLIWSYTGKGVKVSTETYIKKLD